MVLHCNMLKNHFLQKKYVKNGYALEYIKVKTEDICKLAVETHCYALAFVKEQFQTEELCIFAVRQDKIVLNNIKDITMKEKIFNLLLKKN